MADFISDEEMEKLDKGSKSPDFISDEDLSKLEPSSFGLSLEGLGRGALEALPIAGSLVGGVIGSGVGPIGTIGGASGGAVAGKALEQAGKKYFFNEGPQTRSQQLKELGMEAIGGAAGELGGQAAGKLVGKAIEKAPGVLTKLGSAFTGVSEQEIKTYAKNADKIKEMAQESDNSVMEAANQIRKKYQGAISDKINSLNKTISELLSNKNKSVDYGSVVNKLEEYKSALDPHLYREQVGQIDDIIGRVKASGGEGPTSVAKVNEIKQFLQDKAASAYRHGEMFPVGKEAANAAKDAAREARSLVDIAEPGVTEANRTLSQLHHIEESMKPGILKIDAPEAALLSAGTGGNPGNVKALKELGEITGTNMLEDAQNLAAMRTFNSPSIMPVDTTGKSATRLGAASALGWLSGGPIGAAAGGVLSSPMTLKGIINAGRALSPAVKAIAPSAPTREMLYKGLIQKYFESPTGEMKEQAAPERPNQSSIMDKIKGSKYEIPLQNALKNGGDRSFAAANYVLMSRDPDYRELINQENEA